MSEAWRESPVRRDTQASLTRAYPREDINAARDRCLNVMRKALSRRSR